VRLMIVVRIVGMGFRDRRGGDGGVNRAVQRPGQQCHGRCFGSRRMVAGAVIMPFVLVTVVVVRLMVMVMVMAFVIVALMIVMAQIGVRLFITMVMNDVVVRMRLVPVLMSMLMRSVLVRLLALAVLGAALDNSALDAVALAAAARTAMARAATVRAIFALFLGLAMGAFVGLDQRLPVGDRDLVIIGMDFAEGQEAVAVAAILDEGSLQRRFDPGDFGEIDVAAKLLTLGGLEIELFNAIAADHNDPGLFRVGSVDQHFVGHFGTLDGGGRVVPGARIARPGDATVHLIRG
jgi:hypothetical protein